MEFYGCRYVIKHDKQRSADANSGLIFLALLLPTFIQPLVGRLSDNYGSRWLATIGFLLSTPLFVCLRFVVVGTMEHKVLLSTLLALIGFLLSFVLSPLMAEISRVVNEKEACRTRPDSDGTIRKSYAQAYALCTWHWDVNTD